MKEVYEKKEYGPLLLRLGAGVLFVLAGFGKLFNPSGIIGMLDGLGFPLSGFLGWIVILSELVFGFTLLFGFKTKYTVWPLAIILVTAIIFVTIPGVIQNPMATSGLLFHIITIFALISIYLTGPGKFSV